MLDGFELPLPQMSREAMAHWLDGYFAGCERGEVEAYERAYREADDRLARSLAAMLGGDVIGRGPEEPAPQWTRVEAVRRHLASMAARARRRRHDT